MDNNALTDFPELNAEPIQAIEDTVVTAAEDADKELGSLLAHKGFQRLMASMKADIDNFKTGAFIKEPENKTLEEVGKLFVIHQTVASFLNKYLTNVESAAKAVADAERAKQPN